MNDERLDREVRSLLDTAEPTPPLEPGWEQRAAKAMARVRPAPPISRLRLLTTAVGAATVLLALGFAPYSVGGARETVTGVAAQQAFVAEMAPESVVEAEAVPTPKSSPMEEHLAPYGERAMEFVEQEHPEDSEMLVAAAVLRSDSADGVALLKDTALTTGSPAAWAAYVSRLVETGPTFMRVGDWGSEPEDEEGMAKAERMVRESNLPTELSLEQVAPILEALRGWEAADPENAMPVALEVRYLYGLHRDAEALARWEDAGRLPKVTVRFYELAQATARLLSRMGMSEMEATTVACSVTSGLNIAAWPRLRRCSRFAMYEGRLAQLRGRSEDAIRWWHGTVDLGVHMQESADTIIGFLEGQVVHAIGASPAWKWHPDTYTGLAGGPLREGRYFYGPQHDFYVSQVGEAADAELRRRLVEGKVRSQLARDSMGPAAGPFLRWSMLLGLSVLAVALLVELLILFAAISIRARRQADEATELRPAARAAIVVLGLLPAVSAGATYWWQFPQQGLQPTFAVILLVAWALTIPAVLLLALLAARTSRRPEARLTAAWRGNLRKVVPACMAVCAVLSLALGIPGKTMRRNWLRDWYSPGYSEIDQLIHTSGSAWTDPEIPLDSWRAEYPTEPKD